VRKNCKQKSRTTDKGCLSKRLSGELGNLVWTDVERFLRNPQVVLDQLGAGMKQTSNNEPFEQRLFHLQKELEGKGTERNRLLTFSRKGHLDESALTFQLAELTSEEKELKIK
jgi:hypothetical protein